MPDPTTNFGWNPPNVAADSGSWGAILNTLIDEVDTDLQAVKVTADAALPKAGGVMTGRLDAKTGTLQVVGKGAISGAQSLDLSAANAFTATVNGNTTFTFANEPGDGFPGFGFMLRLTNGGAHTITWPADVRWASGVVPALTAAGTDLLVFVTLDSSGYWIGNLAVADIS